MHRRSYLHFEVTLLVLLAGCDQDTALPALAPADANSDGPRDLTFVRDMTVGPPDWWGDVPLCVSGTPGCTGDPCTKAADCAKGLFGASQQAQCLKSVNGITYEGGFCTSTCRPSKNDPNDNYINRDCPGGSAVCAASGPTGQCVPICTSALDCRDQYVCANTTNTPAAGCVPIGASACDPDTDPRPQGRACPMGQRCISYSPDSSYGQCAPICDPVTQDCPPPKMGTNGCVVDFRSTDGSGTCLNVNGGLEGDPCIFLNDCAAGMMCYQQKCREFCRTGVKGCPQGQTCHDIEIPGIQIKFGAIRTGICAP